MNIGSAAGTYYIIVLPGITYEFMLTGLRTISVSGVTLNTYTKLAADTNDAALKAAYTSAASGGPAAIIFFVAAMIFSILYAVSASIFVNAVRSPALAGRLHPCFARPGVSLALCGMALLCTLVGAAIGWGTMGPLAALTLKNLAPFIVVTGVGIVAGAGAALAGIALLFLIIAMACEAGARSCCKGGPAGALPGGGPLGGSTVVIVQQPAVFQQQPFQQPNFQQPGAFVRVDGAPAPPAPAPPAAKPSQWVPRSDGKDSWFEELGTGVTAWAVPPGGTLVPA